MDKTLFMLCGLPGTGKSSWVGEFIHEQLQKKAIITFHVMSTDDLIESIGGFYDKTYNEIFAMGLFEHIEAIALRLMAEAFTNNCPFVFWDQTNLTKKSRAKKLAKVPKDYKKICVCFGAPEEKEWQRRLDSRFGKTIPVHVIKNMRLEIPSVEEGFDEVIFHNFPLDMSEYL